MADEIVRLGGKIVRNSTIKKVVVSDGKIESLIADENGEEKEYKGDYYISSMPVKDLIEAIGKEKSGDDVYRIATELPYRDFITVGLLLDKLHLRNKTKIPTINNIVPDCWVYVQDRNVKMGRFQIYNNWSPYLVKDLENTVWVGLEYFCYENDDFWNQSEEDFAKLGVEEMIRIGIISDASQVLDTHMERVKKAYPAYFDTYAEIDTLINWLNTIDNLYCVGRNGQHRYNNLDHSMMTSFQAVKCILSGSNDRTALWNVNTEKEYHEEKQDR